MSEILITHSYFLRFDPKQWRAQQPYPPLATLYAAAVLLQEKQLLSFQDMMFAKEANEIEVVIKQDQPKFFVIYDDGFNYLTKMCLTNMREAAFEMAAIAKKEGCTIIVSSSDATDHSELYLKNHFDFIIVGEGEQTLKELVAELKKEKKELQQVNGLRFLHEQIIVETNPRANLKNLDLLPLPAWQLLDIEPYRACWLKSKGYFSINIATTRGCPYKCNWCAKPIYGNRYNSRSPQHVITELLFLKSYSDFDHVWFCDDIFGLKPGWVNEFASLLHQNHINIKFKIQSRVDLLLESNSQLKESTIQALARAGCDEVWLGAESGSQRILDAMDKGTKIEQIYAATKLLKQNGIKPCFFLQFGYTGENMADIKLTLKMLFKLMPHDIGVSVSYPLPGTKFYENVKNQMNTKTNWTDSDDLAIMFDSNYPPIFYKKLQRYVHYRFRANQAYYAFLSNFNPLSLFSLFYRLPLLAWSRLALLKYVS